MWFGAGGIGHGGVVSDDVAHPLVASRQQERESSTHAPSDDTDSGEPELSGHVVEQAAHLGKAGFVVEFPQHLGESFAWCVIAAHAVPRVPAQSRHSRACDIVGELADLRADPGDHR